MDQWKTDKTDLDTVDIEAWIQRHRAEAVPRLDKLWGYYLGKNPPILGRPSRDPDNRTPFAYGRKIVTTFTGYAYRPGYISYRPVDEASVQYFDALSATMQLNNEPLKTERAGRNTAIFGEAFELHYVSPDGVVPRFFPVDPREVILLFDESPEPRKVIGIRYYRAKEGLFKVEVYTQDRVEFYDRTNDGGGWKYTRTGETPNFYREIPITQYRMGDDALGLIEPVAPLIDDYDVLLSDSMIEFGRFANAYLRIVGFALGDSTDQSPKLIKQTMDRLKSMRVFDRLKASDDVTFLTKDIPKDFIDYMAKLLKEEIHSQSHVPDFASDAFSGALSGAAIERMLFDFENVVASSEADFKTGLYDRFRLMGTILAETERVEGDPSEIAITFRRNIPVDEKDAAEVAVQMRGAGISMRTTLENMSSDIIPDVDEELKRQEEERAAMPDVDTAPPEEPMMDDGDAPA